MTDEVFDSAVIRKLPDSVHRKPVVAKTNRLATSNSVTKTEHPFLLFPYPLNVAYHTKLLSKQILIVSLP